MTQAAAAVARASDWRQALEEAVAQVRNISREAAAPDLAVLFASAEYAEEFSQLLAEAWRALEPRCLIGCSGQGVIGGGHEIEGEPAIALLALPLPGSRLSTSHIAQTELTAAAADAQGLYSLAGVPPEETNAWLVLADPFTIDAEPLVDGLTAAYPGRPIVGGLASGNFNARRTHLFLDADVYDEGAVLLALGGPYTVRTVVSQGATPIGQPWIVTEAEDNVIRKIAQRPAYEVLVDTVRSLSPAMQARVRRNLLIGIAVDEYSQEFGRGDFLIRNLIGADPQSGALAVGTRLSPGQTVQFQLRDPEAADEDLRELLGLARSELSGRAPMGGILCACNGRGSGMFGIADHDVRTITELLGPMPMAGLFCNGEIGPIGARTFVHGFTASLALIVPAENSPTQAAG